MAEFAIFVTIKLKPGQRDAYLNEIAKDRDGALNLEPGCSLFHVLQPEDGDDTVHLYEVYDDEAAFVAHQGMAHFKQYVEDTKDLIADRKIERLTRTG